MGGVAAFSVGLAIVLVLGRSGGRGFHLDEGWRAHAVSFSDVWRGSATNDTPLSLGFMLFARARLLLFGNTESVLRGDPLFLVPVLALVTYVLARKAVPTLLAFVAAAGVVLQTTVVNYTVQFKQFVGEATASALVVLLWFAVIDRTRSRRTRFLAAIGVGLLPLYSTPSIFVVGALSVCWWVRAFVRRRNEERADVRLTIALSAIALLPGLVHAAVFLRHQIRGLEQNPIIDAWDPFYVPLSHASEIPGWLLRMVQSWVPGVATNTHPPPFDPGPPLAHVHGPTSWLVAAAMVLALVGAVLLARRSSALRWILVAFFGSQSVLFVLAAFTIWPFGFNRVNLFLLPCFVIILVAGSWHWIDGLFTQVRARRDTSTVGLARTLTVSIFSAVVVSGAIAFAVLSVRGDLDVRTYLKEPVLGKETGALARAIAEWCGPADVVVTAQQMPQAKYYFRDWDGTREIRVPPEHLLIGGFVDARVTRFLTRSPRAERACLFEAYGVSGELHDRDIAPFTAAGFVSPLATFGAPETGVVTVLGRAAASG